MGFYHLLHFSCSQTHKGRTRSIKIQALKYIKHLLVYAVVSIQVTQPKADIMPVLRNIQRWVPQVSVHANIVQRIWSPQPAERDRNKFQYDSGDMWFLTISWAGCNWKKLAHQSHVLLTES